MGKIRDGGDNEKLYQILEVNKNAADNEIKKNFFRLAKQYHPDVNKTKAAKQKYLDINEAYQTLSDPEKRGVYDAYGMTANEQDNTEEQFGDFGNVFKNMFKGAAAEAQEEQQEMNHRTYQEILQEYEKFFNFDADVASSETKSKKSKASSKGSGQRGGTVKGTNCLTQVHVTFKESINGVKKQVDYEKVQLCGDCQGERVKKMDA